MDFFWLLEKGKKTVNEIYSKVTHMESQVLPHPPPPPLFICRQKIYSHLLLPNEYPPAIYKGKQHRRIGPSRMQKRKTSSIGVHED
jgi:hypothetical protein